MILIVDNSFFCCLRCKRDKNQQEPCLLIEFTIFIAKSTIQSWLTFSINFIELSPPKSNKKIQKKNKLNLRDLEYNIDASLSSASFPMRRLR